MDTVETTDAIVQPDPDVSAFASTDVLGLEEAEASIFALDDIDLYASGLEPMHAGMLQLAIGQYRQRVVEDPAGSNRGLPLTR